MMRLLRGDAGSGSVMILGISFVVVALTTCVGLVSQVYSARLTAAKAADSAALAGTQLLLDGQPIACIAAGKLALQNHALLVSCSAKDSELQVSVAVVLHGVLARFGPLRAKARARLEWLPR